MRERRAQRLRRFWDRVGWCSIGSGAFLLWCCVCLGWGCRPKPTTTFSHKMGKPVFFVNAKYATRDPRWQAMVRGSAHEFLMEKGYQVVSGREMRRLHQFERKLMGSASGPSTSSPPGHGADVVIRLSVWSDPRGSQTRGSASGKAFDANTGQLLAQASASSDACPGSMEFACGKIAVRRTMDLLLRQIMTGWIKQGGHANVLLYIAGRLNTQNDLGDVLSLKIKRMSQVTRFRRVTQTNRRIVIRLRVKHGVLEFRQALRGVLRSTPSVRTFKLRSPSSRVLFLILNR